MSGHSKWSTIKRQKGAADIKRGQTFTKMANAITIAVKEGGVIDPASNFKLRLAIEQARSMNVPKDNIQRAIDRGLGKSGAGGQLELVTYEAFGPGKVALVIEAATDNKNRTTSEIKSLVERLGGTFASRGAVSWLFTDGGLITIAKNGKSIDEVFDLVAEAGADDIEESGDSFEIYTKPSELEVVKSALMEKGFVPQTVEISKKPSSVVTITDAETAKKILTLMERIEDLDDVVKVYSNFDIPEDLLK